MRDKSKYTPMMQQYLTIKENYQDAFVFFRLGDFYELFFEDAQLASKELEIALTGREAGAEERVPMCGVPHHSAENGWRPIYLPAKRTPQNHSAQIFPSGSGW